MLATPYDQGLRDGQNDGTADNDEEVEREERMQRGDRNTADCQPGWLGCAQ